MSLKKLERIKFHLKINKKANAKINKILNSKGHFPLLIIISIFLFLATIKLNLYYSDIKLITALTVFNIVLFTVSLFFFDKQSKIEDNTRIKIEDLEQEYSSIIHNNNDSLFEELKKNKINECDKNIVLDILNVKRNNLKKESLDKSLEQLLNDTIDLDKMMNKTKEYIDTY